MLAEKLPIPPKFMPSLLADDSLAESYLEYLLQNELPIPDELNSLIVKHKGLLYIGLTNLFATKQEIPLRFVKAFRQGVDDPAGQWTQFMENSPHRMDPLPQWLNILYRFDKYSVTNYMWEVLGIPKDDTRGGGSFLKKVLDISASELKAFLLTVYGEPELKRVFNKS